MPEEIQHTELVWTGKRKEVDRVSLPFQVIETVNESKADREKTQLELLSGKKGIGKWRNRLIWGDNKLVMASLLKEFAGKIDLIYIDPPFATGADFSYRTSVGGEDVIKEPSIIEELAYRDTWGKGMDSYLQMMYERLVLIRELLTDNGSIYVHLDWHVGHYVKVILDEIFGKENFRNEICRQTIFSHSDAKQFGRNHDLILFYAKSDSYTWNTQYQEYSKDYLKSAFRSIEPETGRRYQLVSLTGAGQGPAKFFCGKLRQPPPGTEVWTNSHIYFDFSKMFCGFPSQDTS